MFQTTAVQKCFRQQLYRNVSGNSCTEMFQTTALQKCFRQQLYRNVSDNSCTEMFQTTAVQKTKTHILGSTTFLENRANYEIMWKNMAESDRPQVAIQYGACALRTG
jgi:hypothetical protein